jgi:hypothetical protein
MEELAPHPKEQPSATGASQEFSMVGLFRITKNFDVSLLIYAQKNEEFVNAKRTTRDQGKTWKR